MTNRTPFAVNGRFLGQRVTGVQRYARNVLTEMAGRSAGRDMAIPVHVPKGVAGLDIAGLETRQAGGLPGHLWEQVSLPSTWPGPLLNLCNTAPVGRRDQVVCIHDASVFNAPESYSFAFRTAYRMLQPRIVRRAARVTTVSSFSASQIARHLPIRAGDIEVLPNGHEHALRWDPSRAEVAPDIVRERCGGRPFVVALGSRARHKNLALVAQIAPEVRKLGLEVVIAGGDGNVFSSTEGEGLADLISTGYVTDDDLAFLLDRAQCLLFPSWTEGFGLPIVEAMARGCPVISSDRASMPEICGDAALMASPDDPAAWVEHIRALTGSSGLRDELVGRGGEQVTRFSWSTTAEGYEHLMREPVGARAKIPKSGQLNVVVAIATIGRPEVVRATIERLRATQTLAPSRIILSCVKPEDAGGLEELPGVELVLGPRGLPAQRNTAIRHVPDDTDILVFFDDDFVADKDWLSAAAQAFEANDDIVALTGDVLADDIKGPGFSFDEAVAIVETPREPAAWSIREPFSPYGCNMAFRMSAIGEHRFDERLVLYGWLEDRDFAAGLVKQGGRMVKWAGARGVHMGVKSGRIAGDRLGYSQIVNPLYMLRKGTMTPTQVADHVFRNVASNLARTPFPEPYIDRWGRLKGNLRGVGDALRGRLQPQRAADIGARAKLGAAQPRTRAD